MLHSSLVFLLSQETTSNRQQLKNQTETNVLKIILVLALTIDRTFRPLLKLVIIKFLAKTLILWVSSNKD